MTDRQNRYGRATPDDYAARVLADAVATLDDDDARVWRVREYGHGVGSVSDLDDAAGAYMSDTRGDMSGALLCSDCYARGFSDALETLDAAPTHLRPAAASDVLAYSLGSLVWEDDATDYPDYCERCSAPIVCALTPDGVVYIYGECADALENYWRGRRAPAWQSLAESISALADAGHLPMETARVLDTRGDWTRAGRAYRASHALALYSETLSDWTPGQYGADDMRAAAGALAAAALRALGEYRSGSGARVGPYVTPARHVWPAATYAGATLDDDDAESLSLAEMEWLADSESTPEPIRSAARFLLAESESVRESRESRAPTLADALSDLDRAPTLAERERLRAATDALADALDSRAVMRCI